MALCIIAHYQVRSSGVEKVKRAIEEFTQYVQANEPGTKMYVAWQQKDDPTAFVHFFIFESSIVEGWGIKMDKRPNQAEWVCETGEEWSGTHIDFRLEDRGAATVLKFTHGAWQSETDYFVSCNTTWGELMFRLKAAAEGKSRAPLFLAADMSD